MVKNISGFLFFAFIAFFSLYYIELFIASESNLNKERFISVKEKGDHREVAIGIYNQKTNKEDYLTIKLSKKVN